MSAVESYILCQDCRQTHSVDRHIAHLDTCMYICEHFMFHADIVPGRLCGYLFCKKLGFPTHQTSRYAILIVDIIAKPEMERSDICGIERSDIRERSELRMI